MEDIKKLREEHWQKFVDEFVKPLKQIEIKNINLKDDFNNITILRKHNNQTRKLTMPEIEFIYNLDKAQKNKKSLIPYIICFGFMPYTACISDFCRKKLYKTLLANGFDDYLGNSKSIILLNDVFDDNIRDILDDVTLNDKKFIATVTKFINDIEIKIE